MKHIRFKPWVGNKYETSGFLGKKILAIGESFYCSEEQAVATLTDKVVTDYLAIRNGEFRENNGKWTNTYLKFERSLKGKETSPEDSQDIWNSISFYNYLQVPMSGARESGATIDYKNAEDAFLEVINELQPDLIIVWGVGKLFNNLPEDKWSWGKPLDVDGWNINNGYYQLKNKKQARCIAVYHPSSCYSWDWWHKVISSQL
ncbi:MAG: hypothetical protein IKO75_01970 [Bacteroidales bacterium]|nr:hypothetical protein [Bacteroidales bacterium]